MLRTLHFKEDGPVPNNPVLPVLIYQGAFSGATPDMASTMEKRFAENGWPPQWRNGVYPYHHYHCDGHEVLGIAAGEAKLVLGGEHGERLTARQGDVLLLPAGTGHCRISASGDFLVVGAYPPGQHADIQREAATAEMKHAIADLSYPKTDPVFGAEGPLLKHW
jgi:uncharacterized protein YjlB